MLKFIAHINGRPLTEADVHAAYLIGQENVPLRSEISISDGMIYCRKQAMGPAALALLWPVKGAGTFLLETTRLPERDDPYNLNIELARARLQLVGYKQADWGLYDYHGGEPIYKQIRDAEAMFIESLQRIDDPAEAAVYADRSLGESLPAGENLALFHASIFLSHRRSEGRKESPFGCVVDTSNRDSTHWERLDGVFDHVTLPVNWQAIEPREQSYDWAATDAWVEWLAKHPHIAVRGSPLVSFSPDLTPDWLFVWQNDFEHVRDLVQEHVGQVLGRYGKHIKSWCVLSGVHRDNDLGLTFEQLMELTRLSANLFRRLQPGGRSVIDLVMPWGEYYARSQRTIPPALYADVAVQSGVSFDALGLQLMFGYGEEGYFLRDLLQISNQLERFASLGKPLQLTAVGVPSDASADVNDRWKGAKPAGAGGEWTGPWTEERQADWLEKFCRIAFSKPYVESVTWRDMCDGTPHVLPHAGLLRADGTPKPAYHRLVALRQELFGGGGS
jgi:hypothetical protein